MVFIPPIKTNTRPTKMDSIHFSKFPSLTDTKVLSRNLLLKIVAEHLTSSPEIVDDKRKVKKLYSFMRYKPNTTRANQNITHATGIVLDFDFKDALDSSNNLNGHEYIKDLLKNASNLNDYYYIYHTTFSYSPHRPNFRLIVPYAPEQETPIEQHKDNVKNFIRTFFPSHQAIDNDLDRV